MNADMLAAHQAIDTQSLQRILRGQGIRASVAASACLSELTVAKNTAEIAAIEAKKAQEDATQAQKLANALESELAASNKRNDVLSEQTKIARERAGLALAAVKAAEQSVERNRLALLTRTESMQADAREMQQNFEQQRLESEERFERVIKEQQLSAEHRETLLFGFVATVFLISFGLVWLVRDRRRTVSSPQSAEFISGDARSEIREGGRRSGESLAEFVLDGRDEDGIRYLLRVSGDKMKEEGGDYHRPQSQGFPLHH